MFQELLQQLAGQGMISIVVRVHPGAKLARCVSEMADGSYKIDVRAPADEGRANEELIKYLAYEFDTDPSRVEIISGKTSRRKAVRISK